MAEWFENDDFWKSMGPTLFDARKLERAAEEIDGALALLGVEEGAHLLDLCCGPGRHSLELARRGYGVTGVDRNAAYLAEARAANPGVEWVECDMRAFRRDGAFDGAINCFTSFGYFENQADDVTVARNVRASLKPGGRFLIDTMCKEVLARRCADRHWYEHEDGSILLEKREIRDGWKGVDTTWILLRGEKRKTFQFSTRLYSAAELEAVLLEAGFSGVKFYGWFDGSPFDRDARRLVAVAST